MLGVLLESDPKAPLTLALKEHFGGSTDVLDILGMSDDDIDGLSYIDTTAKPAKSKPVPRGIATRLKILILFRTYRHNISKPIGATDWIDITKADYDEFRSGPYSRATLPTIPSIVPSTTKSPADLFTYGIKKDPSAYPTLSKDNGYDQWHRQFKAVAVSQGMKDLFDPSFVPITLEAKELWDVQQNFMYSVLCTKLLTSTGKDLVRDHEANQDAQAILAGLDQYHHQSTKAGIDSSELLGYLTTEKLGTGSNWRGTTSEFILHWVNQLRLYDSNVADPNDKFSDRLKLTMLQNAVEPIAELRQIKEHDAIRKQGGQSPLDFSGYLTLLKSAAQSYDAAKSKAGTNVARRRVFQHDVNGVTGIPLAPYDLHALQQQLPLHVHAAGRHAYTHDFVMGSLIMTLTLPLMTLSHLLPPIKPTLLAISHVTTAHQVDLIKLHACPVHSGDN